jgi:hypothetical protein
MIATTRPHDPAINAASSRVLKPLVLAAETPPALVEPDCPPELLDPDCPPLELVEYELPVDERVRNVDWTYLTLPDVETPL